MNLEFSQQIFEKYSNIKFHENPSSGSRVVPCGQTDMTKLIVAFRNFANAPKIHFFCMYSSLSTSVSAIHCTCLSNEFDQELNYISGVLKYDPWLLFVYTVSYLYSVIWKLCPTCRDCITLTIVAEGYKLLNSSSWLHRASMISNLF